MPIPAKVSVTASFYVHHHDESGEISRGQRVSCVDITEELLSLSLNQLQQMAQNSSVILSQLQSFSLERAQYEAMSHYSIALDEPANVVRLFGLPTGAGGLGKLVELTATHLEQARKAHGFEARQFQVVVAQVRRSVKTVSVTATNQFEAGRKALELVEQCNEPFEHHEEEFFVDEVADPADALSGSDYASDACHAQSEPTGTGRDLFSTLH